MSLWYSNPRSQQDTSSTAI